MWNSILETVTKGLANADPKLVETIFQANVDFGKWVKYYNPNDICSLKENDKIVVKILAEDLQDLKMRADYFRYLIKKTEDDKLIGIWTFMGEICTSHFWLAVRAKYNLWDYDNIGMRDGFKIVAHPCNHEMPDVLKRLLGLND